MVILFVIVFALLIGGLWLWVKHLRQEKLRERQRLARIASGASAQPTTSVSAGSNSNAANAGASAPAKVTKLAISSHEADVLDATLRSQMKELVEKWRVADKEDTAWRAAGSEHDSASRAWDSLTRHLYLSSTNPDDVRAYIAARVAAHMRRVKAYAGLVDLVPRQMPAANSVEAALAALTHSLKRVDKLASQEMPKSLLPVVRAAQAMRDSFIGRVASFKEGAETRSKACPKSLKARPKGPSRADIEGKLTSLVACLEAALVCYSSAAEATDDAAEAFAQYLDLDETRFREPQKPTTEEVGRYLQEIEEWSKARLASERKSSASLAVLSRNIDKCQKAFALVKEALDKLSGVKGKDVDETVEATIVVAETMLSLSSLHSEVQKLTEWTALDLKTSPHITTVTPAESAEASTLKGLARTAGYAVAQLNVARAKVRQVEEKPMPPLSRAPSFQGVDVDLHIESYGKWLEEEAQIRKQIEQLVAELEVAKNAREARQAKVHSSAEALAAKASAMGKTFSDSSADELRVTVIASHKLVELNSDKAILPF
ncbi:MAG: hypothetical protein HY711_07095 [Candidatus Melainabacteria bacterium]|nr:hypothetical protein [Candidatus Melainabacteria bacterium]